MDNVRALIRNASLHVTVTDVNDHKPVFDKTIYNGRVAENIISAEVHLTSVMHVTDNDIGQNAVVSFELISPQNGTNILKVEDNASFRIDAHSGRIWSTKALDCEQKSNFELIVIARDAGTPVAHSASATIFIQVEDANDNPPEFTQAQYLFEVGFSVHVIVADILASCWVLISGYNVCFRQKTIIILHV